MNRQELEERLENAATSGERDELMKQLLALNVPREVDNEDFQSDICWGCGA